MDWTEFLVSNDALQDVGELRRRIDEDGYLFFRQLQNPGKLLELRREMLTVMQQGGWLVAETDPIDGIANVDARCTEGDPEYTDVYHRVYSLQSFHESGHWPEVLDVIEKVIGRPVMPQPQKVARLWFPKYTDHTTPIHQDFVHFQGSFDNLTCWTPVGNCPSELGGLAVLRGSHKVKRVLQHHFSLGAGSLHVDPSEHGELEDEWYSTNYEVGDTLVFPALTIHMALPNVTEDRLRVSLDNRYQAVDDPIAEHMLEPHLSNFSPFGWEQVYQDWDRDDLKYYWKQQPVTIVPRDSSYSDQGFDEAIEMARSGNPHARHHLERFVCRIPDSPEGQRAAQLLREIGEQG
ncbi:MAG: phytanoyl-CoA dioxygenase family protein [Planctomycetota bacterium]|nr:phytanoyl-CoA dioxygenase family protein [Planctomycetota bacterium]